MNTIPLSSPNGAAPVGSTAPDPGKIRVSPAEAENLKKQVAAGTLGPDALNNVLVEKRLVQSPPARLKPSWDYKDGLVFVAFPSAKTTYGIGQDSQPVELSQGIEVLVSDGRILDLTDIKEHGFKGFKVDENYHGECVNWSHGSLQQLIEEKANPVNPVNPADLHQRIKANLEFFVDLPSVTGHSSEATASLLSLWVLGTYFMPVWSAYGYVHFDAAFEDSGKSRAGSVLADMAFWPVVLSGPSTIPEWRDTAHFRQTQFFDDTAIEDLPPNGRQMLNIGYKAFGAKVRLKHQSEKGGWTGIEVDVFAPRVFASVAVMDSMLRSRTYRIEMVRSTNTQVTHRDPGFTPWPEPKEQVRDDAYLWAFHNMPQVAVRYGSPDMSLLDNRSAEIGRPLLTLASMIEEAGVKKLFAETLSILKAMGEESALDRARGGGQVDLLKAAWASWCAGNREPSARDIAAQIGPHSKPVEIGRQLNGAAWAEASRHVAGTVRYKIDFAKLSAEMKRLGM